MAKSNAVTPWAPLSAEEFLKLRTEARAALTKWFEAFEDRMLGVPLDRPAAYKAAQLDIDEKGHWHYSPTGGRP